MPKRRRVKRLKTPAFAAWPALGLQATEMMLASAEVINHRLTRMAKATFPLSPRDSAEFLRMGSEKVQAGLDSIVAMSSGVMTGATLPALAGRGMKPFHSRATANAKRLGRIKP